MYIVFSISRGVAEMKPYFVTHEDEVSIHGCVEVWLYTFLISVPGAGEGSASRLGCFISEKMKMKLWCASQKPDQYSAPSRLIHTHTTEFCLEFLFLK